MIKGYYQPTPIKWRKIGDSILFLSASLTGMIAALPTDDNTKMWLMFSCNIAGILGKTITNLFKE